MYLYINKISLLLSPIVVAFANAYIWRLLTNITNTSICKLRYQIYQIYAAYWQILTNIGHRVGHQSGLYESSGRNSTIFLHGIAFRVYLVFSKIGKHSTHWQTLPKTYIYQKGMWFFKNGQLTFAASLKRRKWGLGLPIHIQVLSVFIGIDYWPILVLDKCL